MPRAVVLAGGWAHPGHDLIAAMTALLDARGFDVAVETEPGQAATTIDVGCDLLVVGSCWFAMTDNRYTDEQRADHAVPFDEALHEAIADLIVAACPVLALHTGVISFDGAELWAHLLGGTWNWANSWHLEPAPMPVHPAPGSPIAFESFTVVDELYQGLDVRETTTIVAESDNGDPLVWLHEEAGRVAVNLLSHDRRSLDDPAHRQLNEQLLDWLLDGSPLAGD